MIYEYVEVGKELKKIREAKGRTIEELIEEIKISEEYFLAIEAGDLSNLPSQIYYGLFVRSYCKELGLDADKFLNKYALEETASDSDDDSSKTESTAKVPQGSSSSASSSREGSPLIIAIWVIGILIIVMAAIFWFSGSDDKTDTDVVEDSYSMDAIESEPEMALTIVADTLSPKIVVEPEPVQPEPLRLDLSISELSWVLVMSDGDTVLNRNLTADAVRNLTADTAFIFSIGNPQGVSMILNGRPMRAISNGGRPILNEEINQDNYEDYYLTAVNKPDSGESVVEGN